jgi:hypothetical protein
MIIQVISDNMSDFDTPLENNVDNEMFQDETQKVNIMEKIKPYFGTIFKVIILIAILAVAYYFFFYRYTTVSFEVYNYDTGLSEQTTISLANGSKTIDADTDKEYKLLAGTYSIGLQGELSKLYLKTKIVNIDKSLDGQSIRINVYPSWVNDISDFKLSGPKTVYTNQNVPLDVSLNYSGEPMSVKFLGSGDLNGLQETTELKKGENKFTLSYKNIKKQNDKVKGTIYIEKAESLSQTKTNEFNSVVKKAPIIKITTPKSIYETSAGQELRITFDISNDSQETIDGLKLTFDGLNMDSDIFNGYINQLPQDINIGPKSSASSELILTIPLQEEFEGKKNITFNAIFTNSYATASKKITINYTSPNITIPKITDFGNMVAGSHSEKVVSLENATKYSIKIQESKIVVTGQTLNLEEAIYQNISFDVPATLEPGKTDIQITTVIPYTFVTDKFTAELQLTTDIGILKIPLSFAITGIDVKLEMLGLQPEYTFTFDTLGSIRTPKEVSLKNSGNIDLNIMNIYIRECTTEILISQVVLTPYTLLKTTSQQFYIVLKEHLSKDGPSFAQGPKICSLVTEYIDPKTKAQLQKVDSFTIKAGS